jgi:hypothetical protein
MINDAALRLVTVTVDEMALPIGVAAPAPKLTELGLATSGPAAAEVPLAPPGSDELHPDNNKLMLIKIAETLRYRLQFLRLPEFFRNLLSGELVTIYRLLKFMSTDKRRNWK